MTATHWLMKTEPGAYSIQDLADAPGQITHWDGVRNYQARNFMRDAMKIGHKVLFYHSVTKPGIVGTAEVVREGYPDHTAEDPESRYFAPKHSPSKPIWYMVDIKLVEIFPKPLPLPFLRTIPELAAMELLRKGSRLSIQPVRPEEYQAILTLAHAD